MRDCMIRYFPLTPWPRGPQVGKRSNSENTALYVAFPFRLFGVGKSTDISLARQSYAERPSPCNDGWCQDLIQAAMLNFTDEAATQVAMGG